MESLVVAKGKLLQKYTTETTYASIKSVIQAKGKAIIPKKPPIPVRKPVIIAQGIMGKTKTFGTRAMMDISPIT